MVIRPLTGVPTKSDLVLDNSPLSPERTVQCTTMLIVATVY